MKRQTASTGTSSVPAMLASASASARFFNPIFQFLLGPFLSYFLTLQGQEPPRRLDLRRLHRHHDPHCRIHEGARHHRPGCRRPYRKLQHLSKSMLANWYHQGECFCGAEGHTPDCPDLVNNLIAPAMQVSIWIFNLVKYLILLNIFYMEVNKFQTFLCAGHVSSSYGDHHRAVPRHSWSLLNPHLTPFTLLLCNKGCALCIVQIKLIALKHRL